MRCDAATNIQQSLNAGWDQQTGGKKGVPIIMTNILVKKGSMNYGYLVVLTIIMGRRVFLWPFIR